MGNKSEGRFSRFEGNHKWELGDGERGAGWRRWQCSVSDGRRKNVINARPTSDFRYTGNIATESVLKKMTGVFLSVPYNCPVWDVTVLTLDRWAEGFMGWGQLFRLRHITSGRYLAVTEDHQLVTFHRSVATEDSSAFVLRQSKVSHCSRPSLYNR